MWLAIDILAFIAMAAYIMYALALAEFHADLLIFAGLLFIAAMVDRVRWSIDHYKGGDNDDDDRISRRNDSRKH